MKIVTFHHNRPTHTFICLPGLVYCSQVQKYSGASLLGDSETSPSVWDTHSSLLISHYGTGARGRVAPPVPPPSFLLTSISAASAVSPNGFHFLFHLIWHFISWRWLWNGVLSVPETHSISAKNLSLPGKAAEDTIKKRRRGRWLP